MTREQGRDLAAQLFKGAPPTKGVHKSLMMHTVDHLFGNVWQGPELAVEERSLVTCAVLIATGRESEQFLHFRGARNLGIPREKLEELITHVAHYAGWPVAVSASRVLAEVCETMDSEGQ
jgi:alkylhydroperoxidase/carboxymuconolactone decarboxylase family protein YurZ